MNQAQLLHQARQKDLEAIKTLLNQSLHTRKLELIEVVIEDNCLTLKVQSKNVPNQYKLLPFLRQEISSLILEGIETVKVYGLTVASDLPVWEETLILDRDWTLEDHLAKTASRSSTLADEEYNQLEIVPENNIEETVIEEQDSQDTVFLEQTELDTPLEEDLDIESPTIDVPIQKVSFHWLPLLISLGIGFLWGVFVGLFLGYQRYMSILESNTPNPSEQILIQPNNPY